MPTIPRTPAPISEPTELQTGDRMTREEFHRLYERAPNDFKAELIGGTVYVASPLRRAHGNWHLQLGVVFATYESKSPGVEGGDNATVFLGEHSEPQPDLYLRILPEYGGQSTTSKTDYVVGAPELVAEVASASRSIDLHAKKEDYALHGVREYLVLSLLDSRLLWFDLAAGRELSADPDGIIRPRCFPGLWIDPTALFARDHDRLINVLHRGMASPEHAAFVDRLAQARRAH